MYAVNRWRLCRANHNDSDSSFLPFTVTKAKFCMYVWVGLNGSWNLDLTFE